MPNKPLVPLTEHQKTLIVNNVLAAVKDITKLNKTGYNFLYQASGFIAHYNLHGFIGFYEDHSLGDDIVGNALQNQWNNFRPNDPHYHKYYDYMMAKKDVYNRILAGMGLNPPVNSPW